MKRLFPFVVFALQAVVLYAVEAPTGKDTDVRTDSDYGTMTLIGISALMIVGILLLAIWKRNKDRY